MKHKIITTADGSKTIHLPEWNETYHSKHGAIQEAEHVYIQAGLDFRLKSNKTKVLNILEFGFGTGLNAFLSLLYAQQNQVKLNYHSIEKYPISQQMIDEVNYAEILGVDNKEFYSLHDVEWQRSIAIHEFFKLKKLKADLRAFENDIQFDVIFFDAFGPRVQPELWEKSVLQKCYDMMNEDAVWVTYSCKGQVKRDLQDVGFYVEKIPGPPGKREMLRAVKSLAKSQRRKESKKS